MRINRSAVGASVCDHSDDKTMGETEDFLAEQIRYLKRPGKSFAKVFRVMSSSFTHNESQCEGSRRWFREKAMGAHRYRVDIARIGMLDAAQRAVVRVDAWLRADNMPPQTHGVRLLEDTNFDNNCIHTKLSVYVYRLT